MIGGKHNKKGFVLAPNQHAVTRARNTQVARCRCSITAALTEQERKQMQRENARAICLRFDEVCCL